jgi:restriction-modification enzyme MmeI-like protein
VVEFLTDNTLGRIWYEMRKGETALRDQCRYLVRRPNEVFLVRDESRPPESVGAGENLSKERLLRQPVYIAHRPKKDPRKLKVLDPACGSGHFLLYCFDLLLTIYEEAYNDPDLGPSLKKDYPDLADLKTALPRLILSCNLHGVDIDVRATQIAALALWLRCQRAYQEIGLKKDRSKIIRSNIVCAEPMPGEKGLLDEFLKTLHENRLESLIRRVLHVPEITRVRATRSMADSLRGLVRRVWDKMQLAGEAGSLLKIGEELKEAIRDGQEEWEGREARFGSRDSSQSKWRPSTSKSIEAAAVSSPRTSGSTCWFARLA